MLLSRETYCLVLITQWLVEKDIVYTYSSPNTGLIIESGVLVQLTGDFKLGIQTHPLIVNEAFAETSLYYKDQLIYTDGWIYADDVKHSTPDSLFGHILMVKQFLEGYQEEVAIGKILLSSTNNQENVTNEFTYKVESTTLQ
jgi:hypothetical protein